LSHEVLARNGFDELAAQAIRGVGWRPVCDAGVYNMNENNPKYPPVATVGKALAQGSVIGVQVGCMAVVVTIGALLLGLWLDGQLHTRPWLTIILLLISMPLSVYIIFRFALRAARTAQARERQPSTTIEDRPSGSEAEMSGQATGQQGEDKSA
jgi:F0F1-type ATP synthase assembly protein I